MRRQTFLISSFAACYLLLFITPSRSMPFAQPYLNSLTMSPHGKCIPYVGDGLMRADGNANYGFKNLKIKPDLIETIPELVVDAELKSLVSSLNAHPNFFSTGCFSQCISKSQKENLDEKQGDRFSHYYRGYIELAFNSSVHVQDAHNYFDLFFRFDSFLRQHRFPQAVKFDWQLEKAYFSEANVGSFSCAIFIRTVASSSLETATLGWQRSLQILETFFTSVPSQFTVGIYKPDLYQPDCDRAMATKLGTCQVRKMVAQLDS